MKNIFGKNWKTTVTGILTAAGYAALTVVSGGTFALKDIAIAAGVAAIGYLAKDAGVSGTDK